MSLVGHDAVLATSSRSGKISADATLPSIGPGRGRHQASDDRPRVVSKFLRRERDRPVAGAAVRQHDDATRDARQWLALPHQSPEPDRYRHRHRAFRGTTQWHAAVRARFYMKGVEPESGEQADTDLREIAFKKNNYVRSPKASSAFRHSDAGLFLPLPGRDPRSTAPRKTPRPTRCSSTYSAASRMLTARYTSGPGPATRRPCSRGKMRPSVPVRIPRRSKPRCAACSRPARFGMSRAGNPPGQATASLSRCSVHRPVHRPCTGVHRHVRAPCTAPSIGAVRARCSPGCTARGPHAHGSRRIDAPCSTDRQRRQPPRAAAPAPAA